MPDITPVAKTSSSSSSHSHSSSSSSLPAGAIGSKAGGGYIYPSSSSSSSISAAASILGVNKSVKLPWMQSGGMVANEGLHYLHKNERVLSATEKSGTSNPIIVNISIDKPSVRSENDIKEIVKLLNFELQRNMRRYVSYT
jgi:hypothetical protein